MLSRKLLEAAGNAGGESLYVEDVFSTYLYTGTGSNQTITNGIDFSGDGGLVWLKNRVASGTNNVLLDTERGGGKFLYSNTADTELDFTGVYGVTFNNNGFTLLDNYTGYNTSNQTAVSWSFRKAEKFFDVVTYTGNGTAGRTVSHNLGSVPGCVIVKSLGANNWQVYHNGLTSAAYSIWLNSTSVEVSATTVWNSTDPTSTEFTVGSSGLVNNSGTTYVAYLFASDAGGFGDDGDENIIKCGSFDQISGSVEVDVGFEPQFLLVKNVTNAYNSPQPWWMFDTMRGYCAPTGITNGNGGNAQVVFPNTNGGEAEYSYGGLTQNGFVWASNHAYGVTPAANYIYIAIRRPMKTPESGTEVFELLTRTGDSSYPIITTGITVDMILTLCRSNVANKSIYDRLRGAAKRLQTSTSALETTETQSAIGLRTFDYNYGFDLGPDQGAATINFSPRTYVYSMFKRAPGFMDVVAYTGDGTASRQITHNLGSAPGMIIVKCRSASNTYWETWHEALPDDGAWASNVALNSADGYGGFQRFDGAATQTAAYWTTGNNGEPNTSGQTYISYLFATLAGVSKVGSYTGTGADLNVDCGFSAGARFILIKRTDSTGDWYVWDSARGIVAGNDPYLTLNSTPAEVTSTDYIDPLSSGFTVTSSAPAGLNASGGTYIFYSIA